MIGSLRGTLAARGSRELVVEVAGVGYRVTATPATLANAGGMGSQVLLHTHLAVREDSLTLYGFATAAERDCFEILVGSHGVGPALALGILSVHGPDELARAVADSDRAALMLVPGVGAKTAARLLIELKSRLGLPTENLGDGGPDDADVARRSGGSRSDVRVALDLLGYQSDEISAALRLLPSEGSSEDLLRLALQALGASR
ncbi:MAG: Holliday junction branch migration protein RuvA [Acidimicrobiales bacterium]